MAIQIPASPPSSSSLKPRDSAPARRKRLSLHQTIASRHPDSPVGSATASPLQPSRLENIMNDDAAEKASRRKSAHFGDLALGRGEPSGSGTDKPAGGAGGKRVVSAMAVQNQLASSTAAGGKEKRSKRISAVGPGGIGGGVPAPVALEVNSTKFEEWMKLATDNKITATNTWNFALIDYFADLTLLRNDEDQSINFQKASCTLDGCVKIWTSRVDSVATETGKLLSGLAGGDAEDQGEGVEGEDEEGGETRTTRKTTHRSEATLAKSFDVLKIKKFDLEFSVDPLFKKTKEDFDEGGAMGLLLNHLGVDGKGRLVFDAGDATVGEEEDVLDPADEDMVDLAPLREYIPSTKRLQSLNISDTLASFKFSSDPNAMPDFATLLGLKDTFDDSASAAGPSGGAGDLSLIQEEEADFFGGEDFDSGAPMASMGGFDDFSAGGEGAGDEGDMTAGFGGGVGMAGPGEHMPFDGRRQAGDLVMALVGGEDGDGMFDYFDKGFGKNWAGAEHWKLRKVTRKDPSAPAAPKVPKAAKAPFTIDFTAPPPSTKTLFASSSKTSITLPKSKRQKREEWLLPDDMHFSSRQLLRLFLKPKYALRVRRNAQQRNAGPDANEEIDENFWARAAADRAEGGENLVDLDGGETPLPFETQFFHDDGDDGGDFGFGFSGESPEGAVPDFEEDDDLWAGTQGQQLKRVRPEQVHFAKKAKRVDVKRLKDDIWTGLRSLVPDPEQEGSSEEEPEPLTPIGEAKQFDTVIQSLRQSYPQDKMSEISTSFCFICLLHLANEEGLRIETARFDGQEGLDVGCVGEAEEVEQGHDAYAPVKQGKKRGNETDDERRDRIVGELQALKVYKDPNAGRAA